MMFETVFKKGETMSELEQLFSQMNTRLTADKAKKINASYCFHIGGSGGETWLVDLTKDSNWVSRGTANSEAQCIISIDKPEDWMALAAGKMNPAMAFMQGKVKVKGNMALALKLQSLIS